MYKLLPHQMSKLSGYSGYVRVGVYMIASTFWQLVNEFGQSKYIAVSSALIRVRIMIKVKGQV